MSFATQNFKKPKIFGNLTYTYASSLDSAKIAALQTQIQSIYPVSFNYVGTSGNYTVTIVASNTDGFESALAFLFPTPQDYTLGGNPNNFS